MSGFRKAQAALIKGSRFKVSVFFFLAPCIVRRVPLFQLYASFLNLPAAGRHSRALHPELFTVPSSLTTLYEFGKRGALKDSPGFEYGMVGEKAQARYVYLT
jgi:hypothetical protein